MGVKGRKLIGIERPYIVATSYAHNSIFHRNLRRAT